MFSQGQLIFGGFFLVAFIIAMIFFLPKDIKFTKNFIKVITRYY
jgi:hypothetical protein